MPALPIPLIFALIMVFLGLRAWVARETPGVLLALIGLCALQAALIALIQFYGLTALRLLQPITAAAIPPLAWVAFVTTARRRADPARDLLHSAAPLLMALIVWRAAELLDPAIPALYISYGLALLAALRHGGDSLLRTRLDSGDNPVLLWRLIAVALLLSAASDILIVWDQAMMQGRFTPWIISLLTSLALLGLGALGVSHSLAPGAEPAPEPAPEPSPEEQRQHGELLARLTTLMQTREPYLDPDLTLSQLARRLQVPAKQLSTAINRETGENVSRFVNGFRIGHATRLMRDGANVTHAMLESGFNTKSNFNREFLRVTGKTPTAWLADPA